MGLADVVGATTSNDSWTHTLPRMPTRGHKRAIGDILRGKRGEDDAPMTLTPAKGRVKSVAVSTITEADLDPARRLLFSWSLRRYLTTKPPSTVVHLSRDEDTIGSAMSKLARHGILAAPVLDERQGHFFG